MAENRKSPPEGRREGKDRRTNPKGRPPGGKERRGQTILREAEVFEVALPPLKGARDRRTGPRRGKGGR